MSRLKNQSFIWVKLQYFRLIAIFLTLLSPVVLAATENGRWHLGIGDPTIHGWITVVFYIAATCICLNKTIALKKMGDGYRFWLCVTIFLLLLGINKQLDLQTWFTQALRDNAYTYGWYEDRRLYQALFIFLLAITTLISLISIRRLLADSWHRHKVTWIGVELLCAFILMRAASFHHMDVFINHHWFGVKFNVLLEIGAIVVVIVGAIVEEKPNRQNPLLA